MPYQIKCDLRSYLHFLLILILFWLNATPRRKMQLEIFLSKFYLHTIHIETVLAQPLNRDNDIIFSLDNFIILCRTTCFQRGQFWKFKDIYTTWAFPRKISNFETTSSKITFLEMSRLISYASFLIIIPASFWKMSNVELVCMPMLIWERRKTQQRANLLIFGIPQFIWLLNY